MGRYNWTEIERRRDAGESWPPIADDYDVTPGTIRKAYSRYRKRKDTPEAAGKETSSDSRTGVDGPSAAVEGVSEAVYLTRVTTVRIR